MRENTIQREIEREIIYFFSKFAKIDGLILLLQQVLAKKRIICQQILEHLHTLNSCRHFNNNFVVRSFLELKVYLFLLLSTKTYIYF